MPEYSITKAAVLSLSRLVTDVHAADGIRSNAVCPGPTLSPAWLDSGGLADQTAGDSDRSRDDVLRAVGAGRPLGRMAKPDEIAAVIAFLCSPRSSYSVPGPPAPTAEPVPVII
jgi:NAD(P)-dependent dehydrogenase (short-subunit alcohol dehydrogenase family)